jgi:hypothetical protein
VERGKHSDYENSIPTEDDRQGPLRLQSTESIYSSIAELGQMTPPNDTPSESVASADSEQAARELEAAQERVLAAVATGAFDTVEQKVAWILNSYPAARDSDVTLQLRYWETFVDDYDPATFEPDDLYRLPRLTSLARSRARIQNKLKLFQATPEVREQRRTMSEEERERAAREAAYPVFAIYADESGKTQDHLVVGSLWVLRGEESYRLVKALLLWRSERKFTDELHFTNVNDGNIERYIEAVDIVMAHAAALGFKSLSIPRRGVGNLREAVGDLFYHIIVGGLEQEAATGRAPLPRVLQLWKDVEEEAADKLLLADIRDRLIARFQEQLPIDFLRAISSRGADLLQIADLFTGSVNRVTNPPNPPRVQPHAKDRFASYFLNAVGWAPGASEGDMAVSVNI